MENVDRINLPKDTQTPHNKEILLDSGEKITLPTLHVSQMSLFHGSRVAGITEFDVNKSDQMTIGKGIYFTPNKESAIGYAKWRSNESPNATLYEAEIKDADIADLRTREAQEQFAKLLREALLDWEENVLPNLKGPDGLVEMLKEQRKKIITETIKKIDENSWKNLRAITFDWADLVSTTLAKQGYKGVMSIEGEPPIDLHDSIVIFNHEDAPIIHQQKV